MYVGRIKNSAQVGVGKAVTCTHMLEEVQCLANTISS